MGQVMTSLVAVRECHTYASTVLWISTQYYCHIQPEYLHPHTLITMFTTNHLICLQQGRQQIAIEPTAIFILIYFQTKIL